MARWRAEQAGTTDGCSSPAGGVTQEGPLSPRVFNLMIHAIVREWIYTDNGLVAAREAGILQKAFDVLASLFDCARQFRTYQRGAFYLALEMHIFLIFSDRLLTILHAMYLVSNKVASN